MNVAVIFSTRKGEKSALCHVKLAWSSSERVRKGLNMMASTHVYDVIFAVRGFGLSHEQD